jgi:hypothetical protein
MNISTPTLNLAILDKLIRVKAPFTSTPFSTLNEKFNIGNIAPPTAGYPAIKYLVIGKGGSQLNLSDSTPLLINYPQHRVDDSGLFEHIPFVMRRTDNDLTPLERSKYRIRKVETYGGLNYFTYYALVLGVETTTVETRVIEVTGGVISSDLVYSPNSSRLSAAPILPEDLATGVTTGRYLSIGLNFSISFDETTVNEIKNAFAIKYGITENPTLTEMGIVGGFDVSTTNSLGSTTPITYTEIRCGQIMSFLQVSKDLSSSLTYGINCVLSEVLPYPNHTG